MCVDEVYYIDEVYYQARKLRPRHSAIFYTGRLPESAGVVSRITLVELAQNRGAWIIEYTGVLLINC